MVQPGVAESSGSEPDGGPSIDEDEEPEAAVEAAQALDDQGGGDGGGVPDQEEDPNVAEVELTDDDFSGDGGDLFDGVEDAQEADESADDGDGGEESEGGTDNPEDVLGGLDGKSAQMESAINDGAARLAVVGLDEDDQDDLEGEFTEVFEAFRLGYFGSQVFEEYMAPEGEDVAPEWGLLGAILCAGAFVIWMRPDGEEKVQAMKEAVEGLINGGSDL